MTIQVQIVKDSFEKAKPIIYDVVNKFFEYWFADSHEVKIIFGKTDIEKQKKALIKDLVFLVDNIDNPHQTELYIQAFVARYLSFGVRSQHYQGFKISFLNTLEYFFGNDWRDVLKSSWEGVMDSITKQLVDGAVSLQNDFDVKEAPIHPPLQTESLKSEEPSPPPVSSPQIVIPAFVKNVQESSKNSVENDKKPLEFPLTKRSEDVVIDLSAAILSLGDLALPEELKERIREEANRIAKEVIKKELDSAIRGEFEKYLASGLDEFIKKSA